MRGKSPNNKRESPENKAVKVLMTRGESHHNMRERSENKVGKSSQWTGKVRTISGASPYDKWGKSLQ